MERVFPGPQGLGAGWSGPHGKREARTSERFLFSLFARCLTLRLASNERLPEQQRGAFVGRLCRQPMPCVVSYVVIHCVSCAIVPKRVAAWVSRAGRRYSVAQGRHAGDR
jgi:hypothetical protein